MVGMVLVVALSCIPLVLVITLIVREAWVDHQQARRSRAGSSVLAPPARHRAAAAGVGARVVPHTERENQEGQLAVRRMKLRNFIAPGEFSRAAFDFTIKRQPAAIRKRVLDQGGFAEVPIVLHDRRGTSFLTHRKICLN